jgi:hypothetical protein
VRWVPDPVMRSSKEHYPCSCPDSYRQSFNLHPVTFSKITASSDVIRCSLVNVCRRFGGTCCLYLQMDLNVLLHFLTDRKIHCVVIQRTRNRISLYILLHMSFILKDGEEIFSSFVKVLFFAFSFSLLFIPLLQLLKLSFSYSPPLRKLSLHFLLIFLSLLLFLFLYLLFLNIILLMFIFFFISFSSFLHSLLHVSVPFFLPIYAFSSFYQFIPFSSLLFHFPFLLNFLSPLHHCKFVLMPKKLNTMTRRPTGRWRYSSTIFDLGTRWR